MAGEQMLTRDQIVTAWKDESYRDSLTEEQRAALPAKPEGEFTDEQLAQAAGATPQSAFQGAAAGGSLGFAVGGPVGGGVGAAVGGLIGASEDQGDG